MNSKHNLAHASALALAAYLALPALSAEPASSPDGSPEPAAEEAREEVVVTARKRGEKLQDVPMAVTAISGSTMEESGQSNLADVGHAAPNVFFEAADRSRPYIYIRGIGTRSYDPGTDSSVGVFIDGVYQARLATLDLDLLDVERIEVLRGPQGTLYGKNTIAGAISVVTHDPTPEFRLRLNSEYGHSAIHGDNLYGVWGDVSGSLSDNVTASVAVAHRFRDGYQPVVNLKDVAGGSEDSWSVRGKMKIDFNENVSLRLSAWYNDASGPPIIFVQNTLNGAAPTVVAMRPGVVIPPPAPPYAPRNDRSDQHLDKTVYGGSATLTWSIGDVELTSITAYQHLKIDELWESDTTTLNANWAENPEDSDQFSEELRLSQSSGRLSWLAGLFYARETADRHDILYYGPDSLLGFISGGLLTFDLHFNLETTSYAAFGQLTYDFTDHISATVGARYSIDKKDALYRSNFTGILPSFSLDLPEQEWDSFDPSASVTYKFNDDISVYASYSTGYKSGAFQFIATTAIDAGIIAQPETVKSYELGFRSMLFDRHMRFNATLFRMDYENLQTFRVVPTPIGGRVRLTNAESAKIEGIEIETQTFLDDDWSLTFNYSYLDARYEKYIFNASLGQDFSGNRMQRAPKHTVNAALQYSHEFDFGRIDARVGYYWRDSIFFEADNNLIDKQSSEPSLGLLDASIALTQDRWTVSLWGTNLTDERYRRSVLNSTGNSQRELWAEPRTLGVRLSYSYE